MCLDSRCSSSSSSSTLVLVLKLKPGPGHSGSTASKCALCRSMYFILKAAFVLKRFELKVLSLSSANLLFQLSVTALAPYHLR